MAVHRRGAPADKRKLKRRDKRPCRSAPAAPTGVTLAFGRKWADHRIHWRGVTRWTGTTVDVAGRAVTVERYEIQLRATDASGVPVELDSGDAAVWTILHPADEATRVVFANLHRPKVWYYQTRLRALNRVGGTRCYSAWTSWTAATQPAGGALSGPPAPTGVAVTTSRTNEATKAKPFVARVVANEVPNWTPTDGDEEPGASHYLVQLAVSNDGGSTTANTREKVVAADEGGTTFFAEFMAIKRGRHVRARVKSFWGETPGAFSAWTAWRAVTTDVGAGPNVPLNIVTTKPKPRVLITTWDPPAVGEDVDEYRVRVYRGTNLRETSVVKNRRHRYDVPDEDAGQGHRVKVTAIDEAGLFSTEVDEGSDTDEGGHLDASVIIPGTLTGPVNFGDGQITNDGTILLPEISASGFETPAVNQASVPSYGSSGNASRSWPAKTRTDSLLLAWVFTEGASAAPTITTPTGWTLVGTGTQGNYRGSLFKIEGAASRGSNVETFVITANIGWTLSLLEVVGAEVQDLTATANGSSATASTGTTATTTQASEIWLAFWGWGGYFVPAGTPSNGFEEEIEQYTGNVPHQGVAAKVVTATGAASSAVALSGTQAWVGRVVTFKAKPAAGTIVTPNAGQTGLYAKIVGGASRLAYKGDDGIDRPLGAQIGFLAYATGTPSHTANNNWQQVAMPAVEYNDLGIFDTTLDRFTVPAGFAGRWLIECRVGFAGNATGNRQLRILKDPSGAAVELDWDVDRVPAAGGPGSLLVSRLVTLAVGDVLQVGAFQNSGGNLAYVGGTSGRHRFSGTFIGPGG